MASCVLLVLVTVFALSHAVSLRLKLLDNTASNGALCLDGTPGGYYFAPGSGSGANKWIIFFQGGGWCYSEDDCWGRSKTALGSSKFWGPTMDMGGITSDDCNNNPTFCNWNRVNLNYCDGNSFSGNRAAPVTVRGEPVYFRGHQILDATLNELASQFGLSKATHVLLSGCSAGGLSTYLHADYVGEQVKALAPSLVQYGAAPVSGFFLLHATVENKLIYPSQMQVIFNLSNATGGLNQHCIETAPPGLEWRCNFAQYSYAASSSRIFILDSALDSWQTACIFTSEPVSDPHGTSNGNCSAAPGWAPCAQNTENCDAQHIDPMIHYELSFVGTLEGIFNFRKDGNGAFVYSCHTHCAAVGGLYNSIQINGVSMEQALSAWWNGPATAPAAQNTHLPCTYHGGATMPRRCNPTCPLS